MTAHTAKNSSCSQGTDGLNQKFSSICGAGCSNSFPCFIQGLAWLTWFHTRLVKMHLTNSRLISLMPQSSLCVFPLSFSPSLPMVIPILTTVILCSLCQLPFIMFCLKIWCASYHWIQTCFSKQTSSICFLSLIPSSPAWSLVLRENNNLSIDMFCTCFETEILAQLSADHPLMALQDLTVG